MGLRHYQLAGLHIGDIAPRVVRDSIAHSLYSIAVTPGEEWAYVGVTPGGVPGPSLLRVRISDGETVGITARLNNALADFNGATAPAVASPDGTVLAYSVGPDSLFVYTPATGASRFVRRGCIGLAAFSPTSDAVICGLPTGNRYKTVNIASGDTTPLVAPNSDVFLRAMQFRWDASGIRVIYSDYPDSVFAYSDVSLADLQTQTTRKLRALAKDGVYNDRASWSADGNTIAYWRWSCLDFGFKSCSAQYKLSVVDLRDSTVRRVAVVNESPSTPVLSPAGDRVAYKLGGTIYLQTLTPP